MAAEHLTESFTKSDTFVSRAIAGEVLLVPIRNQCADLESIYTLDEVAAFIWRMLDDHPTREELLAAVCAEYEVERGRADTDLDGFLARLLAIGAVCRR